MIDAIAHDRGVFEIKDGAVYVKGKGKGWLPWLFLKLFLKGSNAELDADIPIKAKTRESLFIVPPEN